MAANDIQHGGDHYKKLKIQHWDYVEANEIPYLEACAIKYLTRWRDKGGVQDLRKAIHFIEKRIEVEEAKDVKPQPKTIKPRWWLTATWTHLQDNIWKRIDGLCFDVKRPSPYQGDTIRETLANVDRAYPSSLGDYNDDPQPIPDRSPADGMRSDEVPGTHV